MLSDKIKTYLASGWFTPMQKDVMDKVRDILISFPEIDLFSPYYDGVVVTKENDSPEMREKAFDSNIGNIIDTGHLMHRKLLVAIIDDFEPGTMVEFGAAAVLSWMNKKGFSVVNNKSIMRWGISLPSIIAYSDVSGRGLNIMLQQAVWGFANGAEQLINQIQRYIKNDIPANYLEYKKGDFV